MKLDELLKMLKSAQDERCPYCMDSHPGEACPSTSDEEEPGLDKAARESAVLIVLGEPSDVPSEKRKKVWKEDDE